MLLGILVGWFSHRFIFSSKFSELQERCLLVEKELGTVISRCKELDAEGKKFQYKSSIVIKRLSYTKDALAKRCQKLRKGSSRLQNKNADIARKITLLYNVKQGEISKLHQKIGLAKKSRSANEIAASQTIQSLKQRVERLEALLIKKSNSYENQINELKSRLNTTQSIHVLQYSSVVKPDDLTEISGIGPKLSEFLREFGIISFHQLANMSDEEMVRLSDELGDFSDRIFRDKWVDQAKLLSEKHH